MNNKRIQTTLHEMSNIYNFKQKKIHFEIGKMLETHNEYISFGLHYYVVLFFCKKIFNNVIALTDLYVTDNFIVFCAQWI